MNECIEIIEIDRRLPVRALRKSPSKLLGVVKMIFGVMLFGFFGLCVFGGAHMLGAIGAAIVGLIAGLGLRWMMTGLINLLGGRLNFFLSLLPVVLLVVPSYMWAPQFSIGLRADSGVRKKDAEILREVLRTIETKYPNDERFAGTRASAQRGLNDLFATALAQLKAPAEQAQGKAKFPVDQKLRAAFDVLIRDLAATSDGTVYVVFRNENKMNPPKGDDRMLKFKRNLPEIKKAFPDGDAPVVAPGEAFSQQYDQQRRDTFFKNMNDAFERVFKQKGLLVLKPLGENDDRAGKIVFEVKSVASRRPSYYTYTKNKKVAGLLFSMTVNWEFTITDRQSKELYRTKTQSDPAVNITMSSGRNDPAWAPYSVIMDSAYYNYSREVIGRFGMTPPAERTNFRFGG